MENEMNVIAPQIKLGNAVIGHFNEIRGNVKLGKNVRIGNSCFINGDIEIGNDTVIENNVTIVNSVIIGSGNNIFSNTCIGYKAQHLTPHSLEGKNIRIGNNNIIRENCTIHMPFSNNETIIGNDCFLMANTHVSHDTVICDHVIIANNTAIGGHSWIGKYANLGLNSCLHQYCRIGDYAMVGMGSVVTMDVLPFHLVSTGSGAVKLTINRIGFSRNYQGGISSLDLAKLRTNIKSRKTALDASDNPELRNIINEFISHSKRSYYIE